MVDEFLAQELAPHALPSGAIAGDDAAMVESDGQFLSLVQANGPRLYRFILKNIGNSSASQDLAQQAFIDAVHSCQSVKQQSELSTWLFGVAMHLVRNPLPLGQALGLSQHLQHLQLTSQALPESMRSLLLLVAVNELSYEAAAALLTLPLSTVRDRIAGARAKLQARGAGLDC